MRKKHTKTDGAASGVRNSLASAVDEKKHQGKCMRLCSKEQVSSGLHEADTALNRTRQR